jgi:hypothetical protein
MFVLCCCIASTSCVIVNLLLHLLAGDLGAAVIASLSEGSHCLSRHILSFITRYTLRHRPYE